MSLAEAAGVWYILMDIDDARIRRGKLLASSDTILRKLKEEGFG
jgi:hypothetical protein